MKVSIRASKHQEIPLTYEQLLRANCAADYYHLNKKGHVIYDTNIPSLNIVCEVYRTKTQISAIVYFK